MFRRSSRSDAQSAALPSHTRVDASRDVLCSTYSRETRKSDTVSNLTEFSHLRCLHGRGEKVYHAFV